MNRPKERPDEQPKDCDKCPVQAQVVQLQKDIAILEEQAGMLEQESTCLAAANADAAELMVALNEKTAELDQTNKKLQSESTDLASANIVAAELMVAFDEKSEELERANLELRRESSELATANVTAAELMTELDAKSQELEQANTNLIATQEQLVQTGKLEALGGMVAGVAHEINTPIGVCLTAVTNLERRIKDIKDAIKNKKLGKKAFGDFLSAATEAVSVSASSLHRVAALVRSFKEVAADQASEQERQIVLDEYLDEILRTLQPALKKTPHTVAITCQPQIKQRTIPGALAQVITNLVMNATIHAFDKNDKGQVDIKAESDSKTITIKCKDNGKGMNEAVQKRVFEPFFTTKRGSGGTGLGLHIIHNIIVKNLGGEITCESQPGKGTEFKITFPHNH